MKCLCADGGAGGTVVDHVRLFRNRPESRWKYRLHEQILPALKTTGTPKPATNWHFSIGPWAGSGKPKPNGAKS
jgi:hypothetical protein